MKFFCKLHCDSDEKILAVADQNIIGKKFSDKEIVLDVSEYFYKGKLCGPDDVLELAGAATMINAAGKGIISLLTKEEIISGNNVLVIKGVPHAQVYII